MNMNRVLPQCNYAVQVSLSLLPTMIGDAVPDPCMCVCACERETQEK